MKKMKNILSVTIIALLMAALSLTCIFKPASDFSLAERRALAQLPTMSGETILNGEFMDGFESYTVDQFPLRDAFRAYKAALNKYVFGKRDTNGLFMAGGHLSKIDDPVNADMQNHAAQRFSYLYENYIKDTDAEVYFSIVPDKNYVLAKENGYPSLDYDAFAETMKSKTPYMEYIDIYPLMDLEDYYTTDTHWKQERITDVAAHILHAMQPNVSLEADAVYTEQTLDIPFYGVYAGQLPLPVQPDTIRYQTNPMLAACTVEYYDTGMAKTGDMYNMEKAEGKDPYEMFLSGSTPLCVIENPNAKEQRELVLFRDSFGSSLAPLLAQGYSKITVVDIRYIQSSFVGQFVDFEHVDDVLFMYSATLLNNSLALR